MIFSRVWDIGQFPTVGAINYDVKIHNENAELADRRPVVSSVRQQSGG